ncbi:SdrD B-like domain-containing protein, partial [Hydromonas duriensis]|uniref:SdrD B-like domain-containing protein n=1 Tax=Hydromonas duriensis TaxID=1527608 RepID=UPI00105E0FFD
ADVGTCSSCSVSHPLWSVVTNKTSDAAAKKNVRIGDTINYTVTSTITGGASTRDVVLTDTLGTGLTLSSVPAGCSASGSVLSCTVPSGSAAGNYAFTYAATVNAQAQSTVVNTVSPSYGSCATCSTSSVVIKDVALLVTKTAKTKTAKIGDFVRYEVVIENPSKYDAVDFSLIDQPAPGLSYVSGSMNVAGDDSFTVTAEYPLTTSHLDLAAGQKLTLSYMMRVGVSAGQGSLQNCAQVGDASSAITSNRSCASITRSSDPDFEDSRILGTVFEDSNANGIQDEGEPGIPGVRLATVEGLLIETDAYGRYHIEGINPGQWARGSNFIVKVDMTTVPEGAVPTTQNPLVKRLTQGLPGLFNFGFRVPFNTYEPGKPLSFPVMLTADGLFEFDRFDLLEAGRTKLAALAKQLQEDSNTQKGLKVSAYTDR